MTHFARVPSALALLVLTACGQGSDTPDPTRLTAGGSGGRPGSGGASAAGASNSGKGGSGTAMGVGGASATGGTAGTAPAGAGAGGTSAGGASGAGGATAGTDASGGDAGTSGGTAGTTGGTAGTTGGSAGTTGGSAGMTGGAAGTSGGTAGKGSAGGGMGGAGNGGQAVGGSGGMAGGGAGTGGSGGASSCTITAQATQSTAIPTVETVTFTTTQTGVTAAEIDFGTSASGPMMVAPVDLTQAGYKTVLVGMKPSTSYVYRIKSTAGDGTCTSQDYMVTTGALSGAPTLTVTIADAAHHDKGFIVTSSGLNGTSGYIIDPDGKVVWVAPAGDVPQQPSRVHLSWDAKRFIAMSLNVMNTSAGKIQSVAMDGTDAETVSNTAASHHDFTAIPGGIATLLWNKTGADAPCSLVEFPDGGAAKTIVADMTTIYTSNTFHTNAIHYYATDDSYTIGDRNPNLLAKLSRAGQLIWQFGGGSPKDQSKFFSGVTAWQVNHGHHLLADGTFVFFNNGNGGSSAAFVYKLNTQTMAATQVSKFTGVNSMVLGDAQALPNGNFLITGSTSGTIEEVTSTGSVVMTIKAPSGQQFGYSEFRESLYGAPPY